MLLLLVHSAAATSLLVVHLCRCWPVASLLTPLSACCWFAHAAAANSLMSLPVLVRSSPPPPVIATGKSFYSSPSKFGKLWLKSLPKSSFFLSCFCLKQT
ncbi:hypothetical protein RIF29_29446 [Crotalaria pallida]|uniref:Secreted protein n=1 Tax=Crotalaria pallida TaxID=3830 RepID=A0AAN9HXH5_CROPI